MNDYILIGIDGGASKVSGFIVEINQNNKNFSLSSNKAEVQYSTIKDFDPNFKPLSLQIQLSEYEHNSFNITNAERKQGSCLIEACCQVIINLVDQFDKKPVLIIALTEI